LSNKTHKADSFQMQLFRWCILCCYSRLPWASTMWYNCNIYGITVPKVLRTTWYCYHQKMLWWCHSSTVVLSISCVSVIRIAVKWQTLDIGVLWWC